MATRELLHAALRQLAPASLLQTHLITQTDDQIVKDTENP